MMILFNYWRQLLNITGQFLLKVFHSGVNPSLQCSRLIVTETVTVYWQTKAMDRNSTTTTTSEKSYSTVGGVPYRSTMCPRKSVSSRTSYVRHAVSRIAPPDRALCVGVERPSSCSSSSILSSASSAGIGDVKSSTDRQRTDLQVAYMTCVVHTVHWTVACYLHGRKDQLATPNKKHWWPTRQNSRKRAWTVWIAVKSFTLDWDCWHFTYLTLNGHWWLLN